MESWKQLVARFFIGLALHWHNDQQQDLVSPACRNVGSGMSEVYYCWNWKSGHGSNKAIIWICIRNGSHLDLGRSLLDRQQILMLQQHSANMVTKGLVVPVVGVVPRYRLVN